MRERRCHATELTWREFLIGVKEMKKKSEGEVLLGTGEVEEKKRQTDRQTENGRAMGDGQDPFRSEHSECAQEALLAAITEDVAC